MARTLNNILNPGDAQRLEDQASRNGRPQEERYWRDYRAGLESPDRYRRDYGNRDYGDRDREDSRGPNDYRDWRGEANRGDTGRGATGYGRGYGDQRDYRYDQR